MAENSSRLMEGSPFQKINPCNTLNTNFGFQFTKDHNHDAMTLFHGRKFFEAHERKPAEQMNSCNTSNTDLGFLSTFLLLIFPPHSLPNSPIHIFIHSFIQSHVNTSVTDFRFLSFRFCLFFVPSFSFLSSLHPIHSTTHFSNSRPDHLHPGL